MQAFSVFWQIIFSHRAISPWNSLPRELTTCTNLCFHTGLNWLLSQQTWHLYELICVGVFECVNVCANLIRTNDLVLTPNHTLALLSQQTWQHFWTDACVGVFECVIVSANLIGKWVEWVGADKWEWVLEISDCFIVYIMWISCAPFPMFFLYYNITFACPGTTGGN